MATEGPKHCIDIDDYGKYPYTELPHNYKDAIAKFGEDTVIAMALCHDEYK